MALNPHDSRSSRKVVPETLRAGNCSAFFRFFQTVSVSVSVLTLTCISVDRWYAICHPIQFKSTTSRAKKVIVAIWVVSLVFGKLSLRPRSRIA